LYSINNIKPRKVTKKEILKYVRSEDIFRYYLGFNYEINKLYLSPLREDHNPSFNLFYHGDELFYKDFGHSTGDCIMFVSNLYNISYFDTIKLINDNFSLGFPIPSYNKIISKNKVIKNYIPSGSDIDTYFQIKARKFTKKDLSYWSNYELEPSDLKGKVYSVSKLYKNGYLFKSYKDDELAFAYVKDNRIKIYQPESRYKFLSTLKADDIMGLDCLSFKDNFLIITSSDKDRLVLNKMGFDAINTNGETVIVNENYMSILNNKYDVFFINYDNDLTGKYYSKRFVKKYPNYNIKPLLLPDNIMVKDISDYVKLNNLKKGKELINKLL